MKKVAVVTDSNSGISQAEGRKLGVYVLPMPVFINDKLYYEDVDLTQAQFFQLLRADADVKTSQPAIPDVVGIWEEALRDHDELVYIPMSGALSGSCERAELLARNYPGRVFVVDNRRISQSQKISVIEAKKLAELGYDGQEIKSILLRSARDVRIYIAMGTLEYLKRGGRITPAAAAMGAVFDIHPILKIEDGKLDAYAKVRGVKHAKRALLEAVDRDLSTGCGGDRPYIRAAYSCAPEEAALWVEEIRAHFPGTAVYGDPLPISINCHAGPGAVGILWERPLDETGHIPYEPMEKTEA